MFTVICTLFKLNVNIGLVFAHLTKGDQSIKIFNKLP